MDYHITKSEAGMTVRSFIVQRIAPSTKMLKHLKYREDAENGGECDHHGALDDGFDLLLHSFFLFFIL